MTSPLEDRLDRALGPLPATASLRHRLAVIPLAVPQPRPSWFLRHVREMALGGGVASLVSCLLLGIWLGLGQHSGDSWETSDELSLVDLFLGPDTDDGAEGP